MRSPAQQIEGLCMVWDLMPSSVKARLVVPDDPESDTPALRVGGYEAVWLDPADFDVFVFLPVNRFEVVGQRD
jgi:hypothetical protein